MVNAEWLLYFALNAHQREKRWCAFSAKYNRVTVNVNRSAINHCPLTVWH